MFELGILINNILSKYLYTPLQILLNKLFSRIVDKRDSRDQNRDSLFPSITVSKNIYSKQLIQCAVDEFDFIHHDFDDQVPFNWDINNLIELPSYHQYQYQQQAAQVVQHQVNQQQNQQAAFLQQQLAVHQQHARQPIYSSGVGINAGDHTNAFSAAYNNRSSNSVSSEEFETTLDEELTFMNKSKFYSHQIFQEPVYHNQSPFQQQQREQQQVNIGSQDNINHSRQQHQQLNPAFVKAEEFSIDLNDVNSMFDNYILETEASSLLQLSSTMDPLLRDDELDHSAQEVKVEDMPVPKLTKSSISKSKKKPKKVKPAKPTIFQCAHCPANFKVKGYLTRHSKKHSPSKAFLCPFYSASSPASSSSSSSTPAKLAAATAQAVEAAAAVAASATAEENSEESTPSSSASSQAARSLSSISTMIPSVGTICHPTGGFSRRDTFKTHLKALHFIYPPGTKSNSRNEVGGRCAGCFKFFDNNGIWLRDHIEKDECPEMLRSCA